MRNIYRKFFHWCLNVIIQQVGFMKSLNKSLAGVAIVSMSSIGIFAHAGTETFYLPKRESITCSD